MDWLKDFKEELERRRQEETERKRYQEELRRQEKLKEEERKQEHRRWLQGAVAVYPERIRVVRSLLEEMRSAGLVTLKESRKKETWNELRYEKIWFEVTLTHIISGADAYRNYFSVEIDLSSATVWSYAHHHGYERVSFLDKEKKEWTEELKNLLRKAYKNPYRDAPTPSYHP